MSVSSNGSSDPPQRFKTLSPYFDPASCQVDDLSQRVLWLKFKYCKVVHGVLSPQECADLIKQSEARGYERSNVPGGQQMIRISSVKHNDRCLVSDYDLGKEIWNRIVKICSDDGFLHAAHVPTRKVVGLNEQLRFLRYNVGVQYKPHFDNCFVRDDKTDETSYVTLQIYLNDDFIGGSTRFIHEDTMRGDAFVDVSPKTGSVLLFQHHLLHHGIAVEQGIKYTLRTDVMYSSRMA